MSQNDLILDYLERGLTLTPLQAFNLCGTLALHSRIAELRHTHDIHCEMVKVPSGKRVGCYSLVEHFAYG